MYRLWLLFPGLPGGGAITLNGQAQIDAKSCIRCYCCHEMCAEEAIELRSSWLYRAVNR